MKISHKFIEDKECKDDQKCNAMNNAAVICVGSTGTGKSSLIKLFCGNSVKVGHTVKSETRGSSLYTEAGSGRYWLDSQGANDSQGVDDEKVLTDVLKTLYDNNISNIKVIWCISGDFDREKEEFQTQAKFIKSLGDGVWNSCLIVQKKGPIEPDDIDGILEAARNKGANIEYGDKRLFGYTGIDYMTDADKKKDRLLTVILRAYKGDNLNKHLLENGYLNNKQIVEHINERLGHLSPLKIIFAIKKCEKCGVKGDPRFVYAPCHTESEKYHPKSTKQYHKGKLIKIHPASTLKYHPKSTTSHHDGYTRSFHGGSSRSDHYGSLTKGTEWYHPGHRYYRHIFGLQITDTTWSCCGAWSADARGCESRSGAWTYTCCGRSSGSSGCRGEYSCCGRSSGSSGCNTEWSCCNGAQSSHGCKIKYLCCSRPLSSAGCKKKYACCGRAENSTGCKEEWECCKTPSDNAGCMRKYECCDKDEGTSDGCKDRCKACHEEWGKEAGCVETSKKRE